MVSLLSIPPGSEQCCNEQTHTFPAKPRLDQPTFSLNGGQLCISGSPAIGRLLTPLAVLAPWRVEADTGARSALTVQLRQAAGLVLSCRNSHPPHLAASKV